MEANGAEFNCSYYELKKLKVKTDALNKIKDSSDSSKKSLAAISGSTRGSFDYTTWMRNTYACNITNEEYKFLKPVLNRYFQVLNC